MILVALDVDAISRWAIRVRDIFFFIIELMPVDDGSKESIKWLKMVRLDTDDSFDLMDSESRFPNDPGRADS